MSGWRAEVFVDNEWNGNSIVWPDEHSAREAGRDLWSRWTLTSDYRAVEVAEEPTRPTWDVYVTELTAKRMGES